MTNGRQRFPVLDTSVSEAPKSISPPELHGSPAPPFAAISTHNKSPRAVCQVKILVPDLAIPPVQSYRYVEVPPEIQVVPTIFPAEPAETNALPVEPPHHLLVSVMLSVRTHANPTWFTPPDVSTVGNQISSRIGSYTPDDCSFVCMVNVGDELDNNKKGQVPWHRTPVLK